MESQQLTTGYRPFWDRIKPGNKRRYFQLGIRHCIYITILSIALIYETSYKAPNSVKIQLKEMPLPYDIRDDNAQIPFLNRAMLFIEVFNKQFISTFICNFVLRYVRAYPKVTKILMCLLFTHISRSDAFSYFPYADYSTTRNAIVLITSIAFLITLHYILEEQKTQPSSLQRVTGKSILFAIVLPICVKTWILCKFIMGSSPITIYLSEHPEHLEPIKKFCTDSGFNLSNIRVLSSGSDELCMFTIPLFFKKLDHIFIYKTVLQKCIDGVVGTLYHEVAHTCLLDHLITHLVFFIICFIVFFFSDRYIIPNLNTYKLFDYVDQGIRLAILTKLAEYVINVLSSIREYSCDTNAISDPENALGLLKFFIVSSLLKIQSSQFIAANFATVKYSPFSTHPPTLDRIQRIARMYPDMVSVEIGYPSTELNP